MNFKFFIDAYFLPYSIDISKLLKIATRSKTSHFLEQIAKIIKFIYSENATTFCKISTVDLSYVLMVKSAVEISQNFVGSSEYMNFKSH